MTPLNDWRLGDIVRALLGIIVAVACMAAAFLMDPPPPLESPTAPTHGEARP